MFHRRKNNNRINKLHEKALRLVYNDYDSSFEALLKKDKSSSIHHQNIHCLLIEIFKTLQSLSDCKILENIFRRRTNTYNLRSQPDLKIPLK